MLLWSKACVPCSSRGQAVRYVTQAAHSIKVPARVKRNPTDILEALASTVKEDNFAANYKYHDDPYFIPTTQMAKRLFALSKESGRKVARWLATEYPTLFMWNAEVPKMLAFYREDLRRPENEAEAGSTEADLDKYISRRWLAATLFAYKNIHSKTKGFEIPLSTKQRLLEFLCFCNGQDPEDIAFDTAEWFEERFMRADRREVKPRWTENGEANELAAKIFYALSSSTDTEVTTHAYSTMICAMCRWDTFDKAMPMFEDMKAKGLKPPKVVYDCILRAPQYLKQDNEKRAQFALELLKEVSAQEYQPTLETFNSFLSNFAIAAGFGYNEELILKTLREMKALGVEPNLTTYYCLLRGASARSAHGVLTAVVAELQEKVQEGSALQITDGSEANFFALAMQLADRNHDKYLANDLMAILKKGDHYLFLANEQIEHDFYMYYMKLMARVGEPEELYRAYTAIIPHYFSPDDETMRLILTSVESSRSFVTRKEFEDDRGQPKRITLPRLWDDYVYFGKLHLGRPEATMKMVADFLDALLRATDEINRDRSWKDKQEAIAQLAAIGWDFGRRIDFTYAAADANPNIRQPDLLWSGFYLGRIAVLCARAKKAKRVWTLIDKLETEEYNRYVSAGDYPQQGPIEELVAFTVERNDLKRLFKLLKLAEEAQYPGPARVAMQILHRENRWILLDPQTKDTLMAFYNRTKAMEAEIQQAAMRRQQMPPLAPPQIQQPPFRPTAPVPLKTIPPTTTHVAAGVDLTKELIKLTGFTPEPQTGSTITDEDLGVERDSFDDDTT